MPRALLAFLPGLMMLLLFGGRMRGEEPSKPSSARSLLRQIDEGFVQIFEQVSPAVVVIEATKKSSEEENREDWRGFFFQDGDESGAPGRHDGERPRLWPLPQSHTRSEGSGFIIRPDGYILTNQHVIADAEKLEVRLKDGRRYPAKLVGADDRTDIAVIKIEAKELPITELGDSDKLRVGQLVCAIGAPFNQDYSFTCGWVSGKGRTNLIAPSSTTILYEDYIQTDAFINPGNSGGPLFDVEGRVVGMNTLINGIGRGLAFAIPSNMLQEVSAQLISTGRVQRSWIGIRMDSLQTSSARDQVAGLDKGVIVNTIEANAPAYKSDLRPADIITEVDGVKLGTARDLQKEILKKKVGQLVQLTVWRNGAVVKIPVTTAELPGDLTKVANPLPKKALELKFSTGVGLELKDVQPTGAVIVKVAPDSPASGADLQPADVIAEVENKPATDAATAMALIADARDKKKGVHLTIERKGRRTVSVIENDK